LPYPRRIPQDYRHIDFRSAMHGAARRWPVPAPAVPASP
jgi:hypothetical protein